MKKILSLLLIILCLIGAIGGYYYANKRPTLFLPAETDLSDPTRYAFLTEKDQAAALVADMQKHQTFGRLALAAPAENIQIDPKTATLYYSNGTTLYAQNLKTGERQQQTLANPITHLVLSNSGLVVATNHSDLFILNEKTLKTIEHYSIQGKIITLHNRPLSNDWFAVTDEPPILIHPENHTIDRIALTNYEHIGATALSPDGNFLALPAIRTDNTPLAVIWSIHEDKPLVELPLSAAPLRPFIDNRSQFIYFLDKNGEGLKINTDTFHAKNFKSLPNAQEIAIAYLETRLLIRGEDHVEILDTDNLNVLQQFDIPKTSGLFITGDSKNALISQKEHNALTTIALKNGGISEILLPETLTPTHLFMGASNTLCH